MTGRSPVLLCALALALALATAPWPAAAAPGAADAGPATGEQGPSLLQAEQPSVRAGNEALAAGDAARALSHYDAAEQAVGPRAEIDFDRGNAHFAQGKQAEARQAWKRAQEADARGQGTLSSRALQNMGNSLEASGDRDGAVRAFSEALRRDPANEDARYNLEVLLRRKAEGKGAPKDPGEQGQQRKEGPPQPGAGEAQQQPSPGGAQQQQEKAGQQGEPPPAQQPQGQPAQPQPQPGDGKDEGRREPAGGEQRDERGQGGQDEPRPPGQGGQGEAPAPGDLDRREAERILDTLRSRERPMPLGPAARAGERRRDVEKDW